MPETRGRKRKPDNTIPAHINPDKLPEKCYWDKSGKGHWYTIYQDETGRNRRKRIADRYATLSELHRLIEEQAGIERNTFDWISDQFKQSTQLKSWPSTPAKAMTPPPKASAATPPA